MSKLEFLKGLLIASVVYLIGYRIGMNIFNGFCREREKW